METGQLLVTFISEFENTQNSFPCGSPFGPFWSVKYINFGQRLLIRTAHHTFVEVDTLRLLVHLPEPNSHFFRLQLMNHISVGPLGGVTLHRIVAYLMLV